MAELKLESISKGFGITPVLGSIALGYVHRDWANAGAEVTVGSGAESQRATISARPMTTCDRGSICQKTHKLEVRS